MSRRVLAAVEDLFFATRIEGVAKQAGVAVEFCAPSTLLERCTQSPPDLVVMDLHAAGDPLACAARLKREPRTSHVPIVAFYSHVDTGLRARALEAKVDHVLPRSAFTARLADWLAGSA